MDVSVSAIPVAGLVGLGVGVDYALFVVARYRENRAAGQDNPRALANAMGTSGAAVVFAGGTVVIATAALAITGVGVLTSIGLATSIMVLLRGRRGHHPAARPAQPAGRPHRHRSRWSAGTARPRQPRTPPGGASATGSPPARGPTCSPRSALLLALAAPALWMQTAFPAAGDAPAETTHRQAYDLLAEGFGTGINAPLLVVVDLDAAGVDAADLPDAGRATSPPSPASPRSATRRSRRTAAPPSSPPSRPPAPPTPRPPPPSTQVRDVIPGNVYVSGITAVTDDLNSQLAEKLPLFIGAVIAVSFLLLMLVFRSVVVPLKAAAHEPALHRSRLRRPGRGLPVGLGEQPARAGGADADHLADHRDHVPDPVRAVHGLRGVPAVADPRGVRRGPATTSSRSPGGSPARVA